jgi:hypothetical protein
VLYLIIDPNLNSESVKKKQKNIFGLDRKKKGFEYWKKKNFGLKKKKPNQKEKRLKY